jgi:ATP-binding cassette, subfamily B, bacterial PglK
MIDISRLRIRELLVPKVFARALSLLGKSQRRKVLLISIAQSSLGFLDLAGVASIGVLSALAVSGIQSKVPGNQIGEILIVLNLDNLSVQQQVGILGLIATGLFVTRTLLSIYLNRKILYFLAHCGAVISGDLIERILAQPLSKVQQKSNQETLYAVTSGVSAITLGLIGSFANLMADLTLLIIIAVGLFIVDPILSVVTVIFFVLVAYILYISMAKRAYNLGSLNGSLSILGNQKILEVLNSYREALVKNRRAYYANEIRESRKKLANIAAEYTFMPQISKYVMEASLVLGALIVSAILFLLQDATQAISTLGVFMAAGSRLAPAILRIQGSAIQIKLSSGSALPALNYVDLLSEIKPINLNIGEFSSNHHGFIPQIDIQDLVFTYPGNSEPTLKNISLSINSGQIIAITGESGAGKSTLVDCLIGALVQQSGAVKISGEPSIDAISIWPGAIGYVPQDVVILNGTIRDNVAFGFQNEKISDELIFEALQKAHLFDHVSDLQNGLNSHVGDKGTSLSGGQRQRLGIARALVSKPKLLILDEATSSLDGKSEADISDSINEFRGEVTTIIIAHRLSTIRSADKVIYMNKGSIEFVGTFDEVRQNVPEFDNQAKLMGL